MRKGFSLRKAINWAAFACVAGFALVFAAITILVFCGVCILVGRNPLDYITLLVPWTEE